MTMKTNPGSRITLINMTTGLMLQICLIVSYLVIPRLILNYFGSDANGLVASVNQLLNYITLVEGGLIAVVTASMYKPLVNRDAAALSKVIRTAEGFYRKIGIVFGLYAIVLAIVYPLASGLDFVHTSILILILAVTNMIRFFIALAYQVLLNADKRQYIVNITQTAVIISGVVLASLSVRFCQSIHLLLGVIGIMYIIQPAVLISYVRKHYTIDKSAQKDPKLLKERWNGFAINVAFFVHNNTDIVILTVFKDLLTVSVYSVYAFVTVGIRSIVLSLANGITPVIGQSYARGDSEELAGKMDVYEYIIFLIVGFILTIGALLISPFVMLYTSGIVDADYYQPVFGYLLVAGEAIHLLKKPQEDLAFAADKFSTVRIPAYIEAALNIVISLILVKPLGLAGVAIGTLVAMIWRLAFHVDLTGRIIKGRGSARYVLKLLLFVLVSAAGFVICRIFLPVADSGVSVSSWIIHAVLYSVIFAVLYLLLSLVAFRSELKAVMSYLHRR